MEYEFEEYSPPEDEDYDPERRLAKRVRRSRNDGSDASNDEQTIVDQLLDIEHDYDTPFEDVFSSLVDSYVQSRNHFVAALFDPDPQGRPIRVMTPLELEYHRRELLARPDATESERQIALRLRFIARNPYAIANLPMVGKKVIEHALKPERSTSLDPATMDALHAIKHTPYESSFASKLYGYQTDRPESTYNMVDWETRTLWMDLCEEIHLHALLRNPAFSLPSEEELSSAPIKYGHLEVHDLEQVHDLLRRTFWDGIDVRDSLDLEPEKSTVIVRYKRLVVGVAFLSAPEEPYITYITVRAGWDSAQIATNMLYLLVKANPHRDITLHVSASNSAMLLYNRFCFKAEEYVIGFYEDYLPATSKASKNAFRIRLRQ